MSLKISKLLLLCIPFFAGISAEGGTTCTTDCQEAPSLGYAFMQTRQARASVWLKETANSLSSPDDEAGAQLDQPSSDVNVDSRIESSSLTDGPRALSLSASASKRIINLEAADYSKHLATTCTPVLPPGLEYNTLAWHLEQEVHQKVQLMHTASLNGVEPMDAPQSAPLDASGFKSITSLCCSWQMEVFFTRLLVLWGYKICSTSHFQGLMHWFSCVPDMDFDYVESVIEDGQPCKYWAPANETCQQLSCFCEGKHCGKQCDETVTPAPTPAPPPTPVPAPPPPSRLPPPSATRRRCLHPRR